MLVTLGRGLVPCAQSISRRVFFDECGKRFYRTTWLMISWLFADVISEIDQFATLI